MTVLGSVVIALFAGALMLKTLGSRARLKAAHDRLVLQHANRLATVGQLAAGIAHELGSHLQVVAGRAKMISTGQSADEDARRAGQIILRQADQMTAIVRGLLDYARPRPALRAMTDLFDVAAQTLQGLQPLASKKAIALEFEGEGPLFAQVDTLQFQQALTNLVMNALQAVHDGGHVRISAGLREVAAPSARGGRRGVFAALGVTDDGPGISEQDKPHVFEPFFTTRESHGSGLALGVAESLVQENGGWIGVESEVGRGACFSIFLPVAPHSPECI